MGRSAKREQTIVIHSARLDEKPRKFILPTMTTTSQESLTMVSSNFERRRSEYHPGTVHSRLSWCPRLMFCRSITCHGRRSAFKKMKNDCHARKHAHTHENARQKILLTLCELSYRYVLTQHIKIIVFRRTRCHAHMRSRPTGSLLVLYVAVFMIRKGLVWLRYQVHTVPGNNCEEPYYCVEPHE
jgi:hypothetical protein